MKSELHYVTRILIPALLILLCVVWGKAYAFPLSCDDGTKPNQRFRFYACTVPPGIGLTPVAVPNAITGDVPVTWPYRTGWIVDEYPTQPMTLVVKFSGWGDTDINWDFSQLNAVVMKPVYSHHTLAQWQPLLPPPNHWPPLDWGGPLLGLDSNGNRWQATIEEIANRGYWMDWDAGITLVGNCFGGSAALTRALHQGQYWRQKVGIVDVILPGMTADPPNGQWWKGEAAWTYDEMLEARHSLHLDQLLRTYFRIQATSPIYDAIGFNPNWGKEVCDAGPVYCYMTWSRMNHQSPDAESPFSYLVNSTQRYAGPEMRWRYDEMQIVPSESSANYVGERGHWNQGIAWRSAGVIDSADKIVVPIRYLREIDMGPGLPDQPMVVNFKLTLRPEHFTALKNKLVKYSIGSQSGYALVTKAGQITIPLTLGSDTAYSTLTIEHYFVEGC